MRMRPFLRQLGNLVVVTWLSLNLVLTPSLVWAANVFVISHLQRFETDLGAATLVVDGIDSNMQLGLSVQGALTVTRFHAKRATLRYKAVPPPSQKSADAPLPANIPVAIALALHMGQIDRLVIEQAGRQQVITDIRFDLSANASQFTFNIHQANTALGQVSTQFIMQNAYPFALTGTMALTQTAGEFPYALQAALSGNLVTFHLHAAHHYVAGGQPFAITPVTATAVQNATDTFVADATFTLDAPLTTQIALRLNAFQNKHLHPQLTGHTALRILASGGLAEGVPLNIAIDAGNSRLQQQSLQLTGQAQVINGALQQLALKAQLAQNTLNVDAARNGLGVLALNWQAALPTLAQLMPGFAGQLSGDGSVEQTAHQFSSQYQVQGTQLQLPQGISIERLSAQGQISNAPLAPLTQKIALFGLSQQAANGELSPRIDATLNLDGSLQQHAMRLHVNAATTQANTLSRSLLIDVTGRYQAEQWSGQLNRLQDDAASVFSLKHPAQLSWSPVQGFQLADLNVSVMQGDFILNRLHYQSADTAAAHAQLASQGQLNQFPIQALLDWLDPATVTTLPPDHLRLSGDWHIQANDRLEGAIHLRQAAGDWQVPNQLQGGWQGVGLAQSDLSVSAHNQQLHIASNLRTATAGHLTLTATTQLTTTADGFAVSRQAPITGHLVGQIASLSWLSRLLPAVELDGQLQADIGLSGTLDAPQLTGFARGQQLGIRVPALGITLRQGMLDLALQQSQVRIQQLQFSGEKGLLTSTGLAQWAAEGWQLNMDAKLDQLQALSRVDRWLSMSGNTHLAMTQKEAHIQGKLIVHAGLLALPKANKPTLDDDVVVTTTTAPVTRSTYAIWLDQLRVDFGGKPNPPLDENTHLLIRGQGLNTALSGQIRLNGMLDHLESVGTLEVSGTYLAYGQTLNIDTGKLIFSGPITNIGLDMLATRQTEAYKVGIQVNGSVQSPQLKLVATPETTNENKIALLVLGQPMAAVGSNELGLLSVAAGALLSNGDSVPLQTKIAQTIGLDQIDVRGSNATNYAVSVGKRINAKLTVGYEKSMVGLLNVGKLTYQLTKRIAIETRTGSDNALDVFYSFSFN